MKNLLTRNVFCCAGWQSLENLEKQISQRNDTVKDVLVIVFQIIKFKYFSVNMQILSKKTAYYKTYTRIIIRKNIQLSFTFCAVGMVEVVHVE